jgi:branched-chain amino acid aminotransferase
LFFRTKKGIPVAADLLPPFDDRDGVIWFDGTFVPWRDAKIHVLNHGLHYASCVFEGVRVYNGKIFKLQEHTQRLFASARALDMQIPFSEDDMNQAQIEAVKQQNIHYGYIRPVVWRGSEMMAIAAQNTRVHCAVAAWESKTYYAKELVETGITMTLSRWRRPAPDTAPVGTKAAGLYMICTLSKHEAQTAGFHDALMLDYRGQIAEATGANIFMIQDGVIHTPKPDCFLDGITRQTVIDLAKKRGYTVVERAIFPDELSKTSEIFLTGTAYEITPVASIDHHRYTPSAITQTLQQDYSDLVWGRS